MMYPRENVASVVPTWLVNANMQPLPSRLRGTAKALQAMVAAKANAEVAAGQTRYFKNVLRFHGVKAPTLDALLKEARQPDSGCLVQVSAGDQVAVSYDLLRSEYGDTKQLGARLLGRQAKTLQRDDLGELQALFDDGHVYDWATCDALCGRVLHTMILRDPSANHEVARVLAREWSASDNSWRQRASCVAFVKLAYKSTTYHDLIFEAADNVLSNGERFPQLGAGWVLRCVTEQGQQARERTVEYIKANYRRFTREALRYAIEKLPTAERKAMLKYKPPDDGTREADAALPASRPVKKRHVDE